MRGLIVPPAKSAEDTEAVELFERLPDPQAASEAIATRIRTTAIRPYGDRVKLVLRAGVEGFRKITLVFHSGAQQGPGAVGTRRALTEYPPLGGVRAERWRRCRVRLCERLLC